jgi:hypothetical protein
MDDDQLFIETLGDLKPRLEGAPTEYTVLGISTLLRKLILDSPSLVAKVNRSRRLRIRFVVNAHEPVWKTAGFESPVFWSIEDGFDPDTSPPHIVTPMEVTLDQLLSRVVMLIEGREITVKDIVSQALYVVGGAHPPRAPKTATEGALEGTGIWIAGYPAGLRPLLAIGRVIVKGLDPLRQRVEGDRPA